MYLLGQEPAASIDLNAKQAGAEAIGVIGASISVNHSCGLDTEHHTAHYSIEVNARKRGSPDNMKGRDSILLFQTWSLPNLRQQVLSLP